MRIALNRIQWRELLLPAAAALILLGSGIFAGHEWLMVKRLSKELEHAREYLSKKDVMLRKQADLERQLQQQKERTRRTLQALPAQEEQPVLLGELNRQAVENKITVAKLIVHPPTNSAGGGGQEVEFEIVLHGTYPNLKNFLSALVSGKRYLTLKSFELIRPEDAGEGVLHARLIFAAYFLPEADLVQPPDFSEPFLPLGKSDPFS